MQASIQPGRDAATQYVLRLGDTCLILGQRIAEWCGHAPVLEEDIALTNMSLDLIGQARALLTHAGQVSGLGHDEDQLAFVEDEPSSGVTPLQYHLTEYQNERDTTTHGNALAHGRLEKRRGSGGRRAWWRVDKVFSSCCHGGGAWSKWVGTARIMEPPSNIQTPK